MAAAMEEELLSCPICFELYKIPKTLPCLHSFCEACLSSYIASSFISQGNLPIGFNCPVCRTLTSPSKTSEDPSTWINCYNVNEGLQLQCEESKRKDVERKSCDICEGGKIDAGFWCRECKVCLCEACKGNHNKFPVLCSHTVCDIQDITLGISDSQEYQNCDQHAGRKYEMYCMDDEKLCCASCIVESHRNCNIIMPIPDAAKTIREKLETFSLTTGLSNMEKENEIISDHVENSLNGLTTKRAEFDREKAEFREKIIERIDNIEKELTADIDAKEEKFRTAYQRELKMSKHREMILRNLKRVLHASTAQEDVRMFFEFSKILQIYNRYQKDIITFRNNFREFDYHVSLKEIEEEFEKSFYCFGSLDVDISMNPDLSLSQLKNGSIKRIYKPFVIKNAFISSGIFLDNGNILVVDADQWKLQIYDGEGLLLSDLKLPHKPWDVACINANVVALTFPKRMIVSIVRLSDMAVLKRIPIEGECYGISYSGGKLAVSVSNEILIMDRNGNVKSKLQVPISAVAYVKFIGEDSVFCTGASSVCAMKFDGTKVASYTHSGELRNISVDCDGNIYIASGSLIQIDKIQENSGNICAYVKKFPKNIQVNGMRLLYFQKNTNKFVASWDRVNVCTFEIIAD